MINVAPIALAALVLAPYVTLHAAEASKPNIIYIVADDMGYADCGVHGCTDIPTPHIDSIANDGVRFTDGYVTGPVCSPTRAALMTGRHHLRDGVEDWIPAGKIGMNADVPTVAGYLKKAGYRTALIGKWHLGEQDACHPLNRGFDEFFGFLGGGRSYWPDKPSPEAKVNHYTQLVRGREPAEEAEYTTVAFGREAVRFIERQKEKAEPFFLHLAFNAVHTPMQAPPDALERVAVIRDQGRRTYAAMLAAMDDAIGQVLKAVRDAGLEEKTLICFISDNGGPITRNAPNHSCNTPLRGGKGETWEGGIRVPFFMSWKGRLGAGAVYREPVIQLDLTATALALAGVEVNRRWPIDGVNLMPFLTGQRQGAPHATLCWEYGAQWAIRHGQWKLAYASAEPAIGLYDLSTDISESHDVSASHPERVQQLRAEWQAWRNNLDGHPSIEAPRLVRKPNILLILADDLGYECVGVNGGQSYKTPNLDGLANTGMRFDHGYVQPLCTPTRVQLMTGQSNVRNYTGFGKIDPNVPTFSKFLKQAGYATCMVGKWQLGKAPDLPRALGFDEALLWQHTLFREDGKGRDTRYRDPILEKDGQVVRMPEGSYGPDEIAKHACDFMARHKDGPFLLYYADLLPHWPFVPPPDSKDWNRRTFKTSTGEPQYFADMVAAMDKTVGRLVAKLDELGIRDNTLILFIGDNGTDGSIRSQWRGQEIRGGKGHATKAGMHVPFIANWPGVISPGSVCEELVDCSDVLPALCEVASVDLPEDTPFDGRSFLPILRGQKASPREWIYSWYSVTGLGNALESAFDKTFKLYADGRFYDMDADPLEQTPLDPATLDAAASASKDKLRRALDQFKDARPKRLRTR